MTIGQVREYFYDKENVPCPITESVVKAGYQQASGGYIDKARGEGVIVDYKNNSPSQYWHLMTYCDSHDANMPFTRNVACGELIFWMAEVSGAVDEFMLEDLAFQIIKSAEHAKGKKPIYDRKKWNREIQRMCFSNIEALLKYGKAEWKFHTFDCDYMRMAENSRYLYIHVATSYGAVDGGGMYMFLYDTHTRWLKCSRDNRDILEFRHGIIKKEYYECDSQEIDDDVKLDEMFSLVEKPLKWYDAGTYTLFLKSGNQIKYFSIEEPELSSYQPFIWIIEHAKWFKNAGTLKRHAIPLRELIHKKFCHCFIPHRITGGEKCIQCERIFHNYHQSLNNTNIVSFSLMSYIKLFDTTDACFHITINLDSKECYCIKVSEDNVESEVQLSEQLKNKLTSQNNINELLQGKWIKEIENCLYDGNYYHYIILQGNRFKRYDVACGFVNYWPLFDCITKELYPFMEPRMMY